MTTACDRPDQTDRFAARIIAWQKAAGRHDLPWQNTRDPYRIWLSEVMLQQTQVAAVIPYYRRFLDRFPDVAALAAATEDEVLRRWAGLGYYARARNLHRAARCIAVDHGGVFPQSYAQVCALPGIGRSTAAAICVFAFGARHAILDGNVKRVLARQFGVAGYSGQKSVADALWRLSESVLPNAQIEAYTQGLMDLGSGVCVRGTPSCRACPVRETCVAYRDGRTAELPAPRPAKPVPERETTMLVAMRHGELLLERRPAPGIWGGLWCFPEVDGARIREECLTRYGLEVHSVERLDVVAHGFTHFRLRIAPVLAAVAALGTAEAPGRLWLAPHDALGAAIPVPVRKILQAIARPIASAENP